MSTIDEMTLLTHLYPEIYPNPPPQQQQQGVAKQRRRRRQKAKADGCEARKRKLTQQQIDVLELNFRDEHKLECEKKDRLAMELGLDPRQVAVWFQNRRARYKSQKLEEEFSQLKAQHDNVVAEKCQLQLECLKLKEQIAEAEKVSRNLMAERNATGNCFSSNSPCSSSYSVELETVQDTDPLLWNYVPVEYEDFSYIHGSGSNNGWVNLFDG